MSDNITTPIPSTTKFKTHDFGTNGHGPGHVLWDTTETEVLGTVTASPTANTVLGRLKDIITSTLNVAQDTSKISNAGTALTPKFQKITASSSGATTIVAAVTSKKIRVLAWDVVVNAAVNFKWQSHTTPTDLTGLYYMAGQGGGVARSFNPVGYFETVAGEALDLNLSGAVAVGGVLTYVEV